MGDSSEHTRTTDFWRRPHTEELVDVHVYLVPSEKWIEQRKLAKRDVIDQAVSSGFVRVLPSTTLLELRSEISTQLGSENVPEAFVFLRSVGRNFTQVRCKQELELKIKSFLPPYAEEPEVYLKEGDYTAVRSASLSVLSRNTLFNNSDSPTEYPTSSESFSESQGGNIISTVNQKPRTLSLDRIEKRNAMSSVKSTPTQLNLQRLRQRNTRPPTPRVKERSFGKSSSKYRSTSINSMKLNESIRESPTELVEERASKNETLDVEKESERIVNSPPPRPPSETSKANKDVSITVPTPTPDLGKITVLSDNLSENHINSETVPESTENQQNDEIDSLKESETNVENIQNIPKNLSSETITDDQEHSYKECPCDNNDVIDQLLRDNVCEHDSARSQFSFDDSIQSKMGNEDIIMDPIKLLQGEGDSLKNSEENTRDHFDEGFHSGELVASEEDSNSIDTLGSSDVKNEEDLAKPLLRAATPMPRSSSFYKSAKLDPEMKRLKSSIEELRAERRLRELKRDALLQKVRDLQKRKASSKDRAREEWRKRYMEVKKSTPRLEDHCGKLRQELEKLVKDMLVSVKTDADSKPHKPSKKTSYKIMIMRLLQEVEDLRRRLQSVTIRLNAETKLRSQAEFEVKRLREDLLHKKTQVTLTRKQTSFPPAEQFFISAV
ncbi:spermatogenesis-associated protein 1-like isoform X2 [Parasteatoda tepidariorum]|uniref:spermatogenesis-associated protein 1-like isoform X2 n=1 Tax=Parasteatoda tepidariorum TaxID=114398 RepID=UPI0039BD40D3